MSDQGPGVAPQEQAHIFQPFFRGMANQGDNRTGAGLGLAIARGIIEAHGGSIRLDANYREGARFIIELPRASNIPL
jgi:signal transduction histidine kinase